MRILGHHTVEDRDNADTVENEGGFKCTSKEAFLGIGYYFWDNHIEYAHHWGNVRYPHGYMICESSMEFSEDLFLDLVGSRDDQIFLQEVWERLQAKHNCKSWPIGRFIELLKELNETNEYRDIFTQKIIRAVNNSVSLFRNDVSFSTKAPGRTNLSPIYIVCIIEKKPIIFHTFRIVYPDFYANG